MEVAKNIVNLKSFLQTNLRLVVTHETLIDHSQKTIKDLHRACSETIATPEAQAMPIYSYTRGNYIKKEAFSTPSVYTANLEQVIYYARYNSLFTKSRKLISDSVMHHIRTDKYSLRTLYFSKPEKISGFCSVFRSMFSYGNYYHTLIDHLPRLYLLDQPDYKDIDEIKLLIPGELTKVEKYFLDKIVPQNIKITLVDPNKIYLIDKLIFPSFLSCRDSGYLPKNYLSYFSEKVCPQRPRNKKNRIYISRKINERGGKRCILNEDELVEKLKDYGFQKYSLENMSIEEQIELFYDASHVIAPHGAGLTNIIFSKGINVVEMFAAPGVLPYYYYLSKSLDHNYKYWCGKANNKDANFEVDIEAILELSQA